MKLLKGFEGHRVVLADYGELPAFSASSYTFKSLGNKGQAALVHRLLQACIDEEIDVIFPLYPFEINPLNEAEVLFGEFNIRLALPDKAVLPDCFHPSEHPQASKDWIILLQGEVLFSTQTTHSEHYIPDMQQLSGAFYLHKEETDVANLRLITI